MILAVDNGLCDLGWAVVAPRGRVLALGVLHQENVAEMDEAIDRAIRTWRQALRLRHVAQAYGCTTLVAEAMSFGGPPKARFAMAISLGLSWGATAALAVALGLNLGAIPPKTWQRAIDPTQGRAIDYAKIEVLITEFISGEALDDLHRIPARRRNHAIDAAGIGICGAVLPGLVQRIAGVADLGVDDEIRTFHEQRARALRTTGKDHA